MAANDSLVEYHYISQRQVYEIVAQRAAASGTHRWDISYNVGPPFAKVNFSGKQADLDNIYDLANRSEAALGANVHRLEVLDTNPIPDGSYLKLTMPLQECVIQPFDDVVVYVGIAQRPRVGTILVGLVGSAANLAGSPSDTRIVPYSGRHASHQIGFEEFIRRTTADSNQPDGHRVDGARHSPDRDSIIPDALDSLAGSRIRTSVERLDGLVRVHVAARTDNEYVLDGPLGPVSRRDGPFDDMRETIHPDHVILGSPVWLRTPEPSVFEPTAARFEELVTDCARVVSGLQQSAELDNWPPIETWTHWSSWCAAELSASLAAPRPLQIVGEAGWWARLRGDADRVMRPHGEAWFIGGNGHYDGIALTANGGVYAEASMGNLDGIRSVVCCEPLQKVESDSDALPEAADRLLFAVLAARTPMCQEGEWSFTVKDGTFCRARP